MAGDDCCAHLLTERLERTRGIDQAHVVCHDGNAQLCLHYDPNLVSLQRVQRLAETSGAEVTDRYRHEQIPFAGLDAADAASNLEQALSHLPGMLHASVSYAAGLVLVAYDSEQLERAAIDQVMRRWHTHPARPHRHDHEHEHDHDHDHGHAPAFLPHWMQERFALLLVGLAAVFLAVGFGGERLFELDPRIAMVFYLLAYLAGGYDVASHALPGLLRGKFDTDVLMLAAALGAAVLGQWPEGAFLLVLFGLGHVGEHYALDRARNAVNALGELMPATAQRRRGDELEEVPVESLQLEDVVVVRPGDRVPVDGRVVKGEGAIDQAPVTGESLPVEKRPGDEVFAGTINQNASLEVRVTRLAADNTLSRVMQIVQEAQSQQSPTQQFTQRFTSRFVPAVLLFTVLVAVVPPLAGWLDWSTSFYRAMLLLVAASPCALAIGTPAAVLAGIGQAARGGVLIKGGLHLENLGRLRVIAFDKTGTLTEGRFEVTDIVLLEAESDDELLALAAAVEQHSNHPLAQAVTRAARDRQLDLPSAEGLDNVAGRGVRSQVDGVLVELGSVRFFDNPPARVVEVVERLEGSGRTTIVVRRGDSFLGVLGLADRPRAGVEKTLRELLGQGVQKLVMLTGDNEVVARQIGDELGVTDVRAGLLPEDKLAAIRQLELEHGPIAMAGDGVNDAPALATATVGIAMGGAGTAVALETADVALMADDLAKLPFAVGLSRASQAIIRQNLFIALSVIVMLILTSVLGLVQLSWAVVFHEGSTILVVLNALRLLAYSSQVGTQLQQA
ncbi:MAG: cadmium-translocating P-type ATPase [Candidatus Eremiobacteraeota bacterium]|nr:cadmium-translocating P-type ATPase [Candidatus Eremiobacteraeota bacterium]